MKAGPTTGEKGLISAPIEENNPRFSLSFSFDVISDKDSLSRISLSALRDCLGDDYFIAPFVGGKKQKNSVASAWEKWEAMLEFGVVILWVSSFAFAFFGFIDQGFEFVGFRSGDLDKKTRGKVSPGTYSGIKESGNC